jgi:predicted MFS family arabinose efflux permease
VCTVFIARHLPADRFAAISGLTLGLGGLGMLLTGTPLAWLIEATSWRMGFWVLGALAVVAWLLIFIFVHEPAVRTENMQAKESVREALAKFGALLTLPYTWGILLMSAVGYASFISLRGLWLGPLLMQRHDFSLVQSGNVALVMSVASLFGAPLFGRLDPGPASRRTRHGLQKTMSKFTMDGHGCANHFKGSAERGVARLDWPCSHPIRIFTNSVNRP